MSSSSGLGGAGAGGFFPASASSQQSSPPPPPPAPFQKVSFPLVLLKPNQPGVECILEVGETLRLVRANGVQLFRFQYSQVKRCPHLRTDATCNCKSHRQHVGTPQVRTDEAIRRSDRQGGGRCAAKRRAEPCHRKSVSPGRPTMTQAAMTKQNATQRRRSSNKTSSSSVIAEQQMTTQQHPMQPHVILVHTQLPPRYLPLVRPKKKSSGNLQFKSFWVVFCFCEVVVGNFVLKTIEKTLPPP